MADQSNSDTDAILEGGEVKGFDFTEQSIRKGFIRKVYSILTCQLLITLSFITVFVYSKSVQEWAEGITGSVVMLVALVAFLVCMITMACSETVRRKSPMNMIFLGIFTLAESFLLGTTSTKYEPRAVMMAVGLTAAICLALTLFAFQTKWDFTAMGAIMVCIVVVLLLFGITAIFVHDSILDLVYASLGVLLFSCYLLYDTQLMLGGKHKYSISPEEYIFAALNLYLDIIIIFLFLLRLSSRK